MVVLGRSRKIIILLPLSMGFKRVICQMKGNIFLYQMIRDMIIIMLLIWARYELKTDFFTFIF